MQPTPKPLRLVNFLIDTISVFIILSIIVIFVYIFYPEIVNAGNIVYDIILYGGYVLYYFIMEFFTGKTIGKMITKTVVKNKNGNKPGIVGVFGRSLLRLIPFDCMTFLFSHWGLHDMLSKTVVVNQGKNPNDNVAGVFQTI